MIKNILIILIVTLSSVYSEDNVTKTCTLISSEGFSFTGDIFGKKINTKEEFVYECSDTYETQGDCKRYADTKEDYNVSSNMNDLNISYHTEDFSGSMGRLFTITQAYEKINNLWSGWKGICIQGSDDGNWDWLSDPYILAGYALTAFGAGFDSYASSASDTFTTASGAQVFRDEAIQYASEVVRYGTCAASAGLNVSQMMDDYSNDGVECDPIDEFCDEEEENSDSQIFTIPESDYNDFLAASPEIEAYIEILNGAGTGVLTIRVINSVSPEGFEAAQAAEELKKMKEQILKIQAALTTFQLASCISSGNAMSANSSSDGNLLSTQNIATMALSSINPMLGMAFSIGANVVSSLATIDSCNNKDEASEKGKRHEATYEAKRHGMCHWIRNEEKEIMLTKQTKKHYCCYDDKITRILVEQVKAQFMHDWQHCTGISLKELQNVKFNPCDPNELASGVDGTKLPWDATPGQRAQAVQYLKKCVDMREMEAEMMKRFGGEDMLLDESSLKNMLEDLQIEDF